MNARTELHFISSSGILHSIDEGHIEFDPTVYSRSKRISLSDPKGNGWRNVPHVALVRVQHGLSQ